MTVTAKKVLVFPRGIFDTGLSLFPWDSIQPQIEAIESTFSWLSRPEAECSLDLVQAIPCAYIRDRSGKCYVLKQVQNTRKDLSKKLSLIVGGHIDETYEHGSFLGLISLNLMRELDEEIVLLARETPRPIGVMIDHSSIEASRHVAFLHEVIAEDVSQRDSEEFNRRSNISGVFMSTHKLAARQSEFDPWSRALLEEHICRGIIQPQPRQHSFL